MNAIFKNGMEATTLVYFTLCKENATADVEIGKSACKVGHQLIPSLKQLMNFYAFQMYWVSKQVWKTVVSNIPKLIKVGLWTF